MGSLVLKPLPGWLAVRTILESIALAFSNTAFGHHLSKSNIENWFALELAFHLDPALEHHEWTAPVPRSRFEAARPLLLLSPWRRAL